MAFGGPAGFAVLLWVRPDTQLLQGISPESQASLAKELLLDAQCLLSVRWNLECQLLTIHGTQYVYASTPRFTVSERTLKNALGNLVNHVDFLRASVNSTAEELVRYRQAREKWKVPDVVTESTSGWEGSGSGETSTGPKRKRF